MKIASPYPVLPLGSLTFRNLPENIIVVLKAVPKIKCILALGAGKRRRNRNY